MQQLDNPPPLFFDQHGALLDGGYVYVGTANADPETSPVSLYWDANLSVRASQPLRTRGGVIVNNGAPANVYMANGDYSMRVRDSNTNLVAYFPTVSPQADASYQPLDSDLTAIAALTTTDFGRSLLTAADAASLRSLAEIAASLALTGGTMTGNIVRSGAGPHVYHMDGSMTSGRIFVTDVGAADPTSADGDIWIQAS